MRFLLIVFVFVFAAFGNSQAFAQRCGGVHVAQQGDTIYGLAETYYADGRKWTVIYYANQEILRNDPSRIRRGMRLQIPCLDRTEEAIRADETPLQREDAEMRLLTGGDYAPFTGRSLPGGGLITEVVNAAFEESPSPVSFSLSWESDWSRHLFPLLDNKVFDVGFPWLQPNCDTDPNHRRCKNFHFSDPLFEMLVLLFVRRDDNFKYASDRDIHGKTLCRPKGYYTHDLDRPGRRWISDRRINLVRGDDPADCFRRLQSGAVDGVTLNEFLGRLKVQELGLDQDVRALERPISIEGLHVLISKTHPRGTTFLYRFNEGLRRLKRSQRYNAIVSRHLSNYWRQINEPAPEVAAAPSTTDPEPSESVRPAPQPAQPQPNEQPGDLAACQALVEAIRLIQAEKIAAALPKLKEASQAQLPYAEFRYGAYLFLGAEGVPKDAQTGITFLKRAAADGLADASYLVGQGSLRGQGVSESVEDFLMFSVLANYQLNENTIFRDPIEKLIGFIEEKFDRKDIEKALSEGKKWAHQNRSQFPDCAETFKNAERTDPGSEAPDDPIDESKPPRPASSGTGFVVSDEGHVITNEHVVENCKKLELSALGELSVDAAVVAVSEEDDLALLKATQEFSARVANFRTHSDVQLGESIYVFGFPLSGLLTTSGNLTSGIISGYEGLGNNSRQFQISAPIQPGNSGGPVVDAKGFVVGVVVSKLDEKVAMEKLETFVQNANFAVKGAIARSFLRANGVQVLGSSQIDTDSRRPAAEIVRDVAVQINCFRP